MVYKKKTEEENECEELVQATIDAVEIITASGKNIQKSVEDIILSCKMPSNKEQVNNSILLAKADHLKRLIALHDSTSWRLMYAAKKLLYGKQTGLDVSDVMAYNEFLDDLNNIRKRTN